MASILFHIFLSLIILSATNADEVGFNATLIHRSSPYLPASALRSGEGDYYMKYYIGSKKEIQYGVIDTGSDLVWLQCKPCENCYPQNVDIFNPKGSTSHETIFSNAPECNLLEPWQKINKGKQCGYRMKYVEVATSEGTLAKDDLSISIGPDTGETTFNYMIIGCGTKNEGEFGKYASSMVGLGRGRLSLISQMGSKIEGKFSYCLPHPSLVDGVSAIYFGITGVRPGASGVISTPLVNREDTTFYHITLEAIIVGDDKYKIPYTHPGKTAPTIGNMFIDSGTTYSHIHENILDQLKGRLQLQLGAAVEDPTEGAKRVCFRPGTAAKFPTLVLQLGGGVSLTLQKTNVYVQPRKETDPTLWCLTFVKNKDHGFGDETVLGAWTHVDFLVGFDILKEKKVYFQEKKCAKAKLDMHE